jgi:hydrogenase maturation protease
MMTRPRILIAGIGNIFLGDDAFGSEVARRLLGRPLPVEVRVVDFGIRGLDLTYALMDGYETVILVDATPRGEAPGTLYVIEPERGGPTMPADLSIETHALDPAKVLRLAAGMGALTPRVLLVGCEPASLADDMEMGLSTPARAAVEEAIPLIESLVARLLQGAPPLAASTPDRPETLSVKEV